MCLDVFLHKTEGLDVCNEEEKLRNAFNTTDQMNRSKYTVKEALARCKMHEESQNILDDNKVVLEAWESESIFKI